MKYTAVIWDFNGTIADDIDLGIGAVNKMLAERGLPILSTREEYRAKLRFPIKDYYADLGFDVDMGPLFQTPDRALQCGRKGCPRVRRRARGDPPHFGKRS